MTAVSDLLASLNPVQKQAVTHQEGAAIVLAGAGSGKTTVLTHRAAWLIEQGVASNQILLVTFTNKAAHEMKQRIISLTGNSLPLAGTFHSICAKFLRMHADKLGVSRQFSIYDSDDQMALMKTIYKQHNLSTQDFNPNGVKAAISNAKNELIDPDEYERFAQGAYQLHTAKVYHWYQRALRDSQAFDFDDLLTQTVRLFSNHKELRQKYQNMIAHVLIDEYQDTNKAQYELTKLLSAPQNNIFVVGDFSQSIYAWRGADYRNMMLLKHDFPHITEYKLEQNYRSHQTILDAATNVIAQNTSHPILKLWTDNTSNEPITAFEANSGDSEAAKIVKYIIQHKTKISLAEMAILYRTNAQSRLFEEAFIRSGIPYRLVGGTKFYERKEIKDVLAYARLVVNPSDQVSEQRAIKLGKRNYAKFIAWRDAQKKFTKPHETLQSILEESQYLDKYQKKTEEDVARIENVQELLSVAAQFESMEQFLENVALIQDSTFSDTDGNTQFQDSVQLMSLHSAKGLEFEVVFMVGMEDGLLPHSRSLLDPDQMEEERRLCYVGITRAKKYLYFTYAKSRYQYGSSTQQLKSRFLRDIPESLIILEQDTFLYESNNRGKNTFKSGYSYPHAGRKIVVDEDMIEDVLNGSLDIDAFIDS